ncbi:MAG: hypothetical protein LBQ92_05195 [Propionibacteriaceae bacterium]|nr:hypothetical protein [Propionibacteriaceae bacterium]
MTGALRATGAVPASTDAVNAAHAKAEAIFLNMAPPKVWCHPLLPIHQPPAEFSSNYTLDSQESRRIADTKGYVPSWFATYDRGERYVTDAEWVKRFPHTTVLPTNWTKKTPWS